MMAAWPGPSLLLLAVATGLLLASLPLPSLLLILLAIGVVLLALIHPLIVLSLALIASPFGALENAVLGSASFDSGQLLLILALVGWIARGLVRREIKVPHTPLTLPLSIFIAAASLSLLAAPDMLLGFKEVIKWMEIMAVMLMVVDLGPQLISNRSTTSPIAGSDGANGVWWIAAMLLLAGLVQALIGIWQFALRGDGPEHFLVLGRFYRAYGTFEQPNPFGGYMNLSVLLALGILIGIFSLWLSQRRKKPVQQTLPDHGRLKQILALSATVIVAGSTVLGLVFSWSRGAWMGFLAGVAVMTVFWPRRLRYGLVVFLIASASLLFLYQSGLMPPSVRARISGFADDLTLGDVRGVDINDENYAVLERLAHWQAALDMARDKPWLGIGFGNYGTAYASYALINWPDPLGHAHNYYLNLLAEVGIIGLAAYGLLWIAVFWQTLRVLGEESWPMRGVALGLLGIWTALTVHHAVDKLYVNNIYIHLGVSLGLLQLIDLHTHAGTRDLDYLEEGL